MSKKVISSIYGADFETDTDGTKAWIVQWCIHDGVNHWEGRDLKSFTVKIEDILKTNKSSYVYFHNLKYDLEFFKYMLYDFEQNGTVIPKYIVRRGNPIFIRLVDATTTKNVLEFRDSMKKIPGKLKDMAKLVNLTKLDGFEFYPGWSSSVDMSDLNNWKYVIRDAEIVAVAMTRKHRSGHEKCTASSDSLHDAIENLRILDDGSYDIKDTKWNTLMPRIGVELDKVIRKAYKGGLNISAHKGIRLEGPIIHADVNSMYPAVLSFDELPIGKPEYSLVKPKEDKLYIMTGLFKIKLKPESKGLAWFIFKDNFDYVEEDMDFGEVVIETKEYHLMSMTNIDYDVLNEWYDIQQLDNSFIEYHSFDKMTGVFADYINEMMKMKVDAEVKGDGFTRQNAKLMMNSLYGRLGLNPMQTEVTLEEVAGLNDLRFVETTVESSVAHAYLPMAIFTTSNARRRLLDYCKKVGPENVIHCDTDSVIHLAHDGEVSGIEYHDSKLGAWKIESRPLAMYEGGSKRYVEITDEYTNKKTINGIKMACAGLPQNRNESTGVPEGCWIEILDKPERIAEVGYEVGHTDYKIQSKWLIDLLGVDVVNTMKKQQKRIPGGCILEETTFTIEENRVNFGRR